MKIFRRITGLVLAFALLHLTASRMDAACATHGGHAETPATALAVADHAGEHGHQHGAHAPAEPVECEHPLSQDCCEAMTSCAPTLDLRADASDDEVQPAHAAITLAAASRPLSRTLAPEPPPPKA